jgi:hypothetical protein
MLAGLDLYFLSESNVMQNQRFLKRFPIPVYLNRTLLLGTKTSLAVIIKERTPRNNGAKSPSLTAHISAKVRQKEVGDIAFERGESED